MADKLFDFTTDSGRQGWSAAHDLEPLQASRQGLVFAPTGADPYAYGPPVPLTGDAPRWLVIRLQASQSGMGQVFFFQDGPTEAQSVRFPVPAGRWETVRVALPALKTGSWTFRIDPPGAKTTIAFLDLEARIAFTEPDWPAPSRGPGEVAGRVVSGGLALECGRGPGELAIRFGGSLLATGHDGMLLGWQETPVSPPRFEPIPGNAKTGLALEGRGGLKATTRWKDSGGAGWTFILTALPGRGETLKLVTALSVDRPRTLVHFPALCLLARAEARRGLFAGVEYLDPPDVSSSEADLRGLQALRHVPDPHVPTLPLMAIQGEGYWLSLEWASEGDATPCFDSPARTLGASEGHLLALLLPDGARPPGSRLPHAGRVLRPGEVLTATATVRAGRGEGLISAISAFVQGRSLPGVPRLPTGWEATLAAGWLDSRAREGDRWRHAWPGEFPLSSPADSVACQSWLAARLQRSDPPLAERLARSAAAGRKRVPATDLGGIGHVPQYAAALTGGNLALAAREVRARVQSLLARFQPDGSVTYSPGRTNLAEGHFEKTANGYSGDVLVQALRALTLHPTAALVSEAVRRLRQLDSRWRRDAPRGAQTWEVPLHTPDILASAHLCAAFVLGYELTGDPELLAAARRWALTGIPFVYLRPVAEPIGPYATIAVLGATQWEAPNWIGLPVQWCGLVYANALFDLAEHDPNGIWKKLADGICASGMLQTWPRGQGDGREGLLPDSFHLPAQVRNDVCINPATLQVPLARSLGQPLYTRLALTLGGPLVHVPGTIERRGPRAFSVTLWPRGECEVFVAGLTAPPQNLRVDRKPYEGRFDPEIGGLTLTLSGRADVSWR
jgi:hypothetical protein